MNGDIKDLLGAAIGDEPPLRIDRDEVFLAGRKRLRRRRLLQSGGVAVAVVVAAFGAVTVTGLVDRGGPGPSVPPAASSTSAPVSTTPGPPSAVTTTRDNPKQGDLANRFTDQLHPALEKDHITSLQSELPGFVVAGSSYAFGTDVRHVGRTGRLEVTIDPNPPTSVSTCADVPAPFEGCTSQDVDGVTVNYGDWQDPSGERKVCAVVVLPGSGRMTVIASNYADAERAMNMTPYGTPVLTKDEMAAFVMEVKRHA